MPRPGDDMCLLPLRLEFFAVLTQDDIDSIKVVTSLRRAESRKMR